MSTTHLGDINPQIRKLCSRHIPSLNFRLPLPVDNAFHPVNMQPCIIGVSTRKADALVESLISQSSLSNSQVSQI